MLSQSELTKVSGDVCWAIDDLIQRGYTRFLFGFASNVDLLFARLVAMHKQDNPRLQLHAVFSSPAEYAFVQTVPRNKRLLSVCDEIHILHEDNSSAPLSAQARFLLENSETIVAIFSVQTIDIAHPFLKSTEAEERHIYYCLFSTKTNCL